MPSLEILFKNEILPNLRNSDIFGGLSFDKALISRGENRSEIDLKKSINRRFFSDRSI
jgi:hypothetical protein